MKKLMTLLGVMAFALGAFAVTTNQVGFESLVTGDLDITATETLGDLGNAHLWCSSSAQVGAVTEYGTGEGYNLYGQGNAALVEDGPGTKYLKLEAESTLFRTLVSNGGVGSITPQALSEDLVVDTLVQFTSPTEGIAVPTLDDGVKFALSLCTPEDGSSTNLYVTAAGRGNGAYYGSYVATNYLVTAAVDPAEWCRVTVRAVTNIYSDDSAGLGFVLYINGQIVSCGDSDYENMLPEFAKSNLATYLVSQKQLFVSIVQPDITNAKAISAVGFKGSGSVDDITLCDASEASVAALPAVFKITWGEGIASFKYNVDGGAETNEVADASSGSLVFALPDGAQKVYVTEVAYQQGFSGNSSFELTISEGDEQELVSNNVQIVGGDTYPTLAAAIAAAQAGDVIQLLSNLEEAVVRGKGLMIGNEITIDLNGKTLTLTGSASADPAFYPSATFAIKTSAVGGKLDATGLKGVIYTDMEEGVACVIGGVDDDYGVIVDGVLVHEACEEDAIVSIVRGSFTDSAASTYVAEGSECTQVGDYYVVAPGVNLTSTWTGSDDHDWTNGANWSTGLAPTENTAVTIPAENVPEGGWVLYIGGNALAKSIAVLGDTTLQRDEGASYNGCIVVQEGITTGATPATLKLNKAFIFAGASEVSISCPIVCANGTTSGFTSNESTGAFNFSGAISGTGVLEFRKAATFSQDLTVASDGLSVRFEAQPTFSNGAVLKGNGTAVWTVEPGSAVQTMLQDSENWTGICELVNVSKTSLKFQDYGNLESTVRLNGVTGYMAFPGNATPQNDATVKVLDIAAGGLTLNDAFHSKTVVFDATKITGAGQIKVGTRSSTDTASTVTKYVFTGDMREFTGALNFGDLQGYRPAIIIATSSSDLPTPSDYGQIIVAEGATAYVNNTWTAPGAMVINGAVAMGASGSIAGVNGIAGAGTISYSALPAANTSLAFREETLTSGIGTIPVWSGSVILPSTTITTKTGVPLIGLSSSNGTIVVKGIVRSTALNSIHLNAGTSTVKGKVQLDGDLYITDGNSNATYTWNEIAGEGDFFVTAAGGTASGITHAITKLTDYTGEITAESSVTLTIGTINLSSAPKGGAKLVALGEGTTVDITNIKVAVNDVVDDSIAIERKSDGIYVVASQVIDPTDPTTPYPSTETTIEAAEAAAKEAIKVPDAAESVVEATDYAEYFKYEVTGEAGAYSVAIVGIADDVVEDANESALEVLDGKQGAKVTVPAGLYYKVTTYTELGGTPKVAVESTLSNGEGSTIAKPGTDKGFIKIEIDAKPIQ